MIQRKADLSHFVFEVTGRCNHNCTYCYNVWKHGSYPKGEELDIDGWEMVLNKLIDQTNIRMVSISGGEPLLYPRIFDLVRLIGKKGLKLNFLTNGSLMIEKNAKKLMEFGVSIFEIPFVGVSGEQHRQIKGADDYEKVMEGIANLTSQEAKVVAVMVATKDNIDDIAEIVEMIVVLGCRGLMFNRINPACKKQVDLLPSIEQLKVALKYLDEFAGKYNFGVACSIPIQPCLIDMSQYSNLSSGYCPSGNNKSYFTIDWLGNVRVCNHSPVILGNLLTDNMGQMMNNDYLCQFKEVIPKSCLGCNEAINCRGGCKAAAEVCYGCLSDDDPLLVENKKIG
ncbi:radical SAM protein [Patescibacteria group bacterium]|nr:radical SAM protein [Patescibacteria group bacterium]